jgi:hypothetical protein
LVLEVELGSNQAMRPSRIDEERAAEQFHPALAGGASQEHDATAGSGLEIQTPLFGKAAACGSSVQAVGVALAGRSDVAGRPFLQVREGRGQEAAPDFGLPQAVERLDGGLKAGFAGRDEDGDDAEAEAQANDAAEGIRFVVRTLETGVIVELRVSGQADGPPVFQEGVEDRRGHNAGAWPGLNEAAVQGNGGKNLDFLSVGQDQVFDHVESVEFDGVLGEVGQIPAGRGRGSAHATTAIKGAATEQNAADGAQRRHGVAALVTEALLDGASAEFAQVARQSQPAAGVKDAILDVVGHAACATWPAGMVRPIHAIQALAQSAVEPALHGA